MRRNKKADRDKTKNALVNGKWNFAPNNVLALLDCLESFLIHKHTELMQNNAIQQRVAYVRLLLGSPNAEWRLYFVVHEPSAAHRIILHSI